MKKIIISKELLHNLYMEEKLPLWRIAEELGTSRQTIANKLIEYAMQIRPSATVIAHQSKKPVKRKIKKIPPYHIKKKFEAKYKELKSISMVAEYFGINIDTAYAWKRRHNIETIQQMSEFGKRKLNSGKPWTDKDTLAKAYSNSSLTFLANEWGCDPATISHWLHKFEISIHSLEEQWNIQNKFGRNRLSSSVKNFRDEILKGFLEDGKLPPRISRPLKAQILEIVGGCQCCGETEVLDIHHIDENHSNNEIINLIILCPNCHAKIHRKVETSDSICGDHNLYNAFSKYAEAK